MTTQDFCMVPILHRLGLDLPVPDHSTLGRRAQTVSLPTRPHVPGGPIHLLVDSTGLKRCGPGAWLIEKHATKKRRSWRKRHLGVDAVSGRILAATLTDREIDDAAQVGALLDQLVEPVALLSGDGADDRTDVYTVVQERHPKAAVVVPPRANAVLSDTAATAPTQRDQHIQAIAKSGRRAWQRDSAYTQRARVEGQIGRFKPGIGPALRFHTTAAQATEIAMAVEGLNRRLDLGRPNSVRVR